MFLKGLILGFSVAAPVGPIGLLCIQRTLERGRLIGFVSGLGAAAADTIYGLVVALGLSAVTAFLLSIESWLKIGGGIFLVVIGLRVARSLPQLRTAPPSADAADLGHAFLSILALTISNPATILLFLGVFAALGVGTDATRLGAVSFVGGVFLGSAAWWLILSFGAGLLRGHLTDRRMRFVNILAGSIIVALGLWSLGVAVAARLG